jgi:hypothetical protein
MIGLAVASRLLDLYQQYYFDRLNREVPAFIVAATVEG